MIRSLLRPRAGGTGPGEQPFIDHQLPGRRLVTGLAAAAAQEAMRHRLIAEAGRTPQPTSCWSPRTLPPFGAARWRVIALPVVDADPDDLCAAAAWIAASGGAGP
jgi:hypothetical protein